MKKSEIKALDKLWSKKVKELANYTCEYCGATNKRLEAAHIVGRRHRTTRWGCWIDGEYDLAGMCLCHACHRFYDEHAPQEKDIIERVVGKDRKERLQTLGKVVAKYQDYDKIKEWISNAKRVKGRSE